MNQGKIVVGVAVVLGICAGLAGYWWNYRIGHRALAFWGQENARLIRLAPKVEYLEVIPTTMPGTKNNWQVKTDLSQARGLIHLRNAILSDDQFSWDRGTTCVLEPNIALRFTDGTSECTLYFDLEHTAVYADKQQGQDVLTLGPLAKSLEQFLARELPRAEQEAATGTGDKQPEPAKSE